MEILLEIYVQPGAKKTAVSGKHDGRLKIHLKSSPVDGKANEELIGFFANLLKLKKKDIKIIRGAKSRIKLLSILTTPELASQLTKLGIEPKQQD